MQALWAVSLQDFHFGYLMASGNLNYVKYAMSEGFWIFLVWGVLRVSVLTSWERHQYCRCPSPHHVKSEEQNIIITASQPRQVCPLSSTPGLPRTLQREAGKLGLICLVDTVYPLIDNKVTFRVSLEILFCTVLSWMAKERQDKTKEKMLCS